MIHKYTISQYRYSSKDGILQNSKSIKMYNYHIGLYLGMDFCTFTQSKNMADVSKENVGTGQQIPNFPEP